MSDNVVSSPGSGGATFRAFQEATTLVDWPANVVSYVTGGSAGAWTLQQVDATHGLPVSVLGTVPVSGTFWQATQPVSAASLPLPTGAATAAKQPAIGTAGTASADVLTVQGIASMTALKVDGSGVTQPVSGTVTANQGGSWSVTVGAALPAGSNVIGGMELVDSAGVNKASISAAGAVKVDNSGVTQPVSGTITANAGTGTFTTSDLADGPVTPGAAATKSLLVGAQFNTSAPTLTTGQQAALQVDSSGNLLVNVKAGGGSGGTSSSFSAAFPATGTAAGASDGTNMKPLLVDASGFLKVNVAAGGGSGGTSSSYAAAFPGTGTAIGFSDGTNMQAARVFDADSGVGTQYVLGVNLRASGSGGSTELLGQQTMAGSLPVAIASNQSALPASQSGTWNVTVNTALPAGTNTLGGVKLIDSGGTNVASVSAAGAVKVDGSAVTQPVSGTVTSNIGTTNGLALDATLTGGTQKAIPTPASSGGASLSRTLSAATTNSTNVKASAGTLYSIRATNFNTTTARFVKLYNKATAPTVGTDPVVDTIAIPAAVAASQPSVVVWSGPTVGIGFSAGIGFGITGALADADTTAVGANDVALTLVYN